MRYRKSWRVFIADLNLFEVVWNISIPLIYCFKGTLWQGESQILDKWWGQRKINTYFWDLTQRNKIIGGIGRGYQNPPFPPEESKNKILRGYCGDQLPLEVLFRLDRLGLWPNDPVRGRRHIRRRSTKVEMKIAL